MSKLEIHRSPPKLRTTTHVKHALNRVLNIAGLQVSTTKGDQVERARLDGLVSRHHWAVAPYSYGLHFDATSYCEFLKRVCGPFASDLSSLPTTGDSSGEGYFLKNGWFESVDADVLYGVIRHFKPQQIIEVGCGYSTRLMRRAINDGQLPTRLTCVDPQPRVAVHSFANEHIQSAVEYLPPSELTGRLAANDILFIDSSHVIRNGGDVPFLYLQVLPQLAPGVLVHIHDIFLPFEYPQEFIVSQRWGWNEQYMLNAFLQGNSTFETIWAAYYVWQTIRERVTGLIRPKPMAQAPSSFWMRKAR